MVSTKQPAAAAVVRALLDAARQGGGPSRLIAESAACQRAASSPARSGGIDGFEGRAVDPRTGASRALREALDDLHHRDGVRLRPPACARENVSDIASRSSSVRRSSALATWGCFAASRRGQLPVAARRGPSPRPTSPRRRSPTSISRGAGLFRQCRVLQSDKAKRLAGRRLVEVEREARPAAAFGLRHAFNRARRQYGSRGDRRARRSARLPSDSRSRNSPCRRGTSSRTARRRTVCERCTRRNSRGSSRRGQRRRACPCAATSARLSTDERSCPRRRCVRCRSPQR